MTRNKFVRVIAVDKRYRKEAYKDVPALSSQLNTYITGQHIDPSKPETMGNLTRQEMEGSVPLSHEKQMKFPYIIRPSDTILIRHMWKYNLSQNEDGTYVNPQDKAIYDYLKLQAFIAQSKTLLQPGQHFYIDDEEAEAEVKVAKRDRIFEAMKLLREASRETMTDIALLLNYKKAGFMVDTVNTPFNVITDKVYDVADADPDIIKTCFGKRATEELFIAKLALYNIIQRKGTTFYDGADYLGDGLGGVITYLKSNSPESKARYSKFSGTLNQVENGKWAVDKSILNTESNEIQDQKKQLEDLQNRYKAYEEFMKNVVSTIRIDLLQKKAEEYQFERIEWDGITKVSDMKDYLLAKYKQTHNII